MIERLIAMYLAPTLILLVFCGILLYDKMVDWHNKKGEKKELDSLDFSLEQKADQMEPELKRLVMRRLSELPEDASFQEIRYAVNRAAVETVSDEILERTIDVFGEKKYAVEWLTANITALGGISPLDVLHEGDGEETVLKILVRIEHGVFS